MTITTHARYGDSLTDTECEIMLMVAEGLSTEEIARRTNYSVDSVRRGFRAVYRKLGANNKAHAVAIAIWRGLLD